MRNPHQALDHLLALPEGPVVLDVVARHPGVWVVGGAVRDALLGREPRELDLLVEGDPAPVLTALGGTVKAHPRFGTATVSLPTPSATVDVARARTETYPAPGALPEVSPASAAEDLHRRDVSVNAIALRPAAAAGGAPELLHVPGALEDLEAGVLRVLHDRSFTDDPTRLWRVARYAARLGFTVEEHTALLAARTDLRTVSGPRLGSELRLALREDDPLAALAAAHTLQPRLLPPGFDPAPRRLAAALELLPDGGRSDLVLLAACCAPVDAMTLVDWLTDLGFPAADRDIVAAGSRASTYMPLHRAASASEIARAARGVPPEVVALAGGEQAARWLGGLAEVRLQITGEDLLAAGVPAGPLVGRILGHVLDQRLDGRLDEGRDAELAEARAELERARR